MRAPEHPQARGGDPMTFAHDPLPEPSSEPEVDASLACTWAHATRGICGRAAVAVYEAPSGSGFPRCDTHDTEAAQRRAADDGWTRRVLTKEAPRA